MPTRDDHLMQLASTVHHMVDALERMTAHNPGSAGWEIRESVNHARADLRELEMDLLDEFTSLPSKSEVTE